MSALPPGWASAQAPDGRYYFIDHNNGGRTTWEDPRNSYYSQPPPPPQQGYPPQQQQQQQQQGGSRFGLGAKIAAGAAVAGLVGFGVGEFVEHERDEDRRLDELENERRDNEYRGDGGYRGGDGYYGGDGGQTTIINEDRGFFGDDRQTIVQSDGYGNTTTITKDDGWFEDTTTVTETDRYGNTVVEEEDSSWF